MGPQTILFVHYGINWIRGSEKCLYDLIREIDREKFRPVLWTNNSKLADKVSAMGVRVYQNPFNILLGWETPRFAFFSWLKQMKLALDIIKNESVDLIHSNNAAPCQWLAVPARLKRIPLILHLHSPYLFRDRTSLMTYAADKLIGVSHAVLKNYEKDGFPANRMQIIYNGIDTSSCEVESNSLEKLEQRKSSTGKEFSTLVTVGSLIHRKGVDLLLHGLKELKLMNYHCRLIVVGDGELKEQLKELSRRLDLEANVDWYGERDDVREILSSEADIFVSGAREEAYGLVLAEAGNCALPVVAPKVDGIPEVVNDGVTGLLYEKENVKAFAEKIAMLIDNPNYAQRLGRQGRYRVKEYFCLQRYVSSFESIYLESIESIAAGKQKQAFLANYILRPFFIRTVRVLARQVLSLLLAARKPESAR